MRIFSAIVLIIAGIITAFGLFIASLAAPGVVPPEVAIGTCLFLFGFAGYQLWMRNQGK